MIAQEVELLVPQVVHTDKKETMESIEYQILASFYTPNDYVTDKYFEVVEYYEKLPALIQSGLGNLEVIEPEPIKQTPLLSKLINGDYHTAQSKSDKNIATSIKFFINNLPSFKQYKNQDAWIG